MQSPTDSVARLARYVEELLENEYAQENIREAVKRLQEGGKAVSEGRRGPRRRGRRLLSVLALGSGIGAGVALATNPELRDRLLGSDSDSSSPPGGQQE